MGASFHWIDKKVVSATNTPAAWTDIDLTKDYLGADSGLPATNVLAYIQVSCNSGGIADISFRPDGETVSWETPTAMLQPWGVAAIRISTTIQNKFVLVPTGSNGRIEWIYGGTLANVDIHLLGYVDVTYSDIIIPAPGVWTGWHDFDASSIVGSKETLCLVSLHNTVGGTSFQYTRPYGATEQYFDTTYKFSIAHTTYTSSANRKSGLIALTGPSGIFQLYRDTSLTIDYSVVAHVQSGYLTPSGSGVFFPMGYPASQFETYDLSAITQAIRSLVIIKANIGTSGPLDTEINARPHGWTPYPSDGAFSVGNLHYHQNEARLLVAITDEDGKIDVDFDHIAYQHELSVVGYIPAVSSTPYVENETPQGVISERPRKIGCTLRDDFGLDISTLDLSIKPAVGEQITAISGGVIQPGFDGVLIQEGAGYDTAIDVQLTTFPEFLNRMRYTFEVEIENVFGEGLS